MGFQTIIVHGQASHKTATVILALPVLLSVWQQEAEELRDVCVNCCVCRMQSDLAFVEIGAAVTEE